MDYLLNKGEMFQTNKDLLLEGGTKVRSGTIFFANRWGTGELTIPKLFTNITTLKDRTRMPGACVWVRFSVDFLLSSTRLEQTPPDLGGISSKQTVSHSSLRAHLLGLIRNKHK